MKDHLKTQCFGLKSLLTPEGQFSYETCHDCDTVAIAMVMPVVITMVMVKKGQSVETQLPPDWSSSGFAFLTEICLQAYREFHMLDNGILCP